MSGRITTAGELRGFLADVLTDLRSKRLTPEEANAIAKVAGEITRSLAVEAATALHGGVKDHVPGSMVIANHADPEPQLPSPEVPCDSKAREPVARILPHNPNADPDKVWCEQCEMKVTVGQAVSCKSKFCKAKEAA